jgi:hypothetical protein
MRSAVSFLTGWMSSAVGPTGSTTSCVVTCVQRLRSVGPRCLCRTLPKQEAGGYARATVRGVGDAVAREVLVSDGIAIWVS